MNLVGLQMRGLAAVVNHLGGQEVELNVRVRHPRPAPDEAPSLQVRGARGPYPVQEPLDPNLEIIKM